MRSIRRIQHHVPGISRQASSAADPKVNFLALEAKWQARWETREGKIQESEDSKTVYHPLAPLYCKHLRRLSILDALNWSSSVKGIAPTTRNSKSIIFDRILELANPGKFEELPDDPHNSMDMETCIGKYGADITRTYVIFRSEIVRNPSCHEPGISQIQQWFESIWKAILLAHDSYTVSQTPPVSPKIPEALYEPNLDTWLDAITNEAKSWVHIPPSEPNILDSLIEEDDCKVWLAAQQALASMMQPIGGRNSLQTIESRLAALTKAIIVYDDAQRILPGVHYHSARVLLCLIAPLAPCFAEECWVVLHYGTDVSSRNGDDDEFDENPLIEEELANDEELRGLPRQGYPDTLRSIFDQPFPVPEHKTTINLLKRPSLLPGARIRKEKWKTLKSLSI